MLVYLRALANFRVMLRANNLITHSSCKACFLLASRLTIIVSLDNCSIAIGIHVVKVLCTEFAE